MNLTPEQLELFKKLTAANRYGDQDENGIDLSLIRSNLQLNPVERLRRNARAAASFQRLQEIGKAAHQQR